MEELLALQAELAKVQEAPSVFKLSEPNIVEIVSTLCEAGLLEVLFTTNGKEYLTPAQLRNEVEDEIVAHGGRVNVVELPTILNVDLPHVERAVESLFREGRDGLQRVGGELITNYYLDSLAEEVEASLRGSGRLTLSELAVQHTLSTDFVKNVVEARLGSLIHARLSGGTLFTPAYVARHTARVRGVMSALTRPVSLPAVAKAHGFSEGLFYDAVAELHASGRAPGVLLAKNSFTPAVHKATQASTVSSFLDQNGVVSYSALAKMSVRDPRAYLESEHPGGIALPSCYMKVAVAAVAEAAVEEAMGATGPGVADVHACLDCSLTDEDVTALCQRAGGSVAAAIASGRYVQLAPGLLMSAALLDEFTPQMEALAVKTAKEEAAAGSGGSGGGKGAGSGGGGGESGGRGGGAAKGGSKGGGGGGKAARREAQLDAMLSGAVVDESDDATDNRKGSRNKKGGKTKAGRAGKAGGGGGKAGGDSDDEGARPASSQLPALESALLAFRREISDVEGLAAAAAAHLFPSLERALAGERARLAEAGASERRRAVLSAQEALGQLGVSMALAAKAVEAMAEEEGISPGQVETLDKALLKSSCAEWLSCRLRCEALASGAEAEGVEALAAQNTPAARKELMAKVGNGPAKEALQPLESALTTKSATLLSFVSAARAADAAAGDPSPPFDKKREKAALANARAALREQLTAETKPAVCLHLVALLLEIDLNGMLLSVPGRLVPTLLDHLRPKLSDAAHATLVRFQSLVQTSLVGGDADVEAELQDALEAVRAIGLNKGEV